MDRTDEVWSFMNLSLVESAETAGRMYHGDLAEYARTLQAIAEKAARLAEYCEERGGDGCGDRGHESAVAAANRRVRKVRKALGYQYPASDLVY